MNQSDVTDLWPAEFTALDVTDPRTILEQQAELLAAKTGGRVEAVVVSKNPRSHSLLLQSVGEGSKRRREWLLTVVLPRSDFYPLGLRVGQDREASIKVPDEEALLEHLKETFGSDATRRTVAFLMAAAPGPGG